MAWAKLHTDILGDPKLMRAARKGARELLYLPWLIAFAKEADDNGRLTVGGERADAVDISALIPGGTPKAVTAAIASLVSIGVLVEADGALCFAQWETRSGGKPSDSPSAIGERVARHRAKQRETPAPDNGNALPVTPGNALHETPSNATEKRRGEERREEKKRGEENDAAPRKEKSPAPVWLDTLLSRWEARVGKTTPAAIKRELGGSVAVHGEEPILAAIDTYARVRIDSGQPLKLEWFSAEIITWIDRSKPVVDPSTGLPNERGMAIMAGAR